MTKGKPNIFPKTIKNNFEEYSEEEDSNEFLPVNKSKERVVKQPQKQLSPQIKK